MKILADPVDRHVTEALHAWRLQYDAGLDFDQALDTSGKIVTGPARRAFRRAADRVRRNDDLEAALGEMDAALPPADRAMIAAGWASGKLSLALDLVEQRRAMLRHARTEMRAGLVLPSLILVAAAFVAPSVPLILGEITLNRYLATALTPIGVLAGAIAALTALNRLRAWAAPKRGLDAVSLAGSPFDLLLLALPVVAAVERVRNRAVVATTLGMATQAGLLLLDALDLTESVTPNGVYRRAVRKMSKNVHTGGNISEVMTGRLWPVEWRAMVEVGQTSGKLDEALVRLGKHAGDTYAAAIKQAGRWLPRLVYAAVMVYIILQMIPLLQRIGAAYSGALEGA